MQAQIETTRAYSGLGTKAQRGRSLVVRADLLDMPGRERMRQRSNDIRRAAGISSAIVGAAAASRAGTPFGGNFSSLFTTPYHFQQSDRGLTYGTTPFPTSGNTSATVMTLGGTTPTVPVAVLIKATNTATVGSGATFSIYYDGGTTPAMTGVALSATPTALTGAGTNLTLAASVASSVNNDTWKATGASYADQSGNGLTFAQATVTKQPIITVGANGHVGLLLDGVDDFLSASFNTSANMMFWCVLKQATWTAFHTIIGCGDAINKESLFQDGGASSPQLAAYNGTTLNGGGLTLGTLGRISATWNTTASSIKVGSNAVVNGTTGAAANLGTGRGLGCDRWNATAVNFANVEVFAWGHMLAQSFAAADSAANTYYGGVTI